MNLQFQLNMSFQVSNFLVEKERQVAAIEIFYDKTINIDVPQVAEYSKADIPRAILTQPFVFIYDIKILPNLPFDSFENYYLNIENPNWYNDITTTGLIR